MFDAHWITNKDNYAKVPGNVSKFCFLITCNFNMGDAALFLQTNVPLSFLLPIIPYWILGGHFLLFHTEFGVGTSCYSMLNLGQHLLLFHNEFEVGTSCNSILNLGWVFLQLFFTLYSNPSQIFFILSVDFPPRFLFWKYLGQLILGFLRFKQTAEDSFS